MLFCRIFLVSLILSVANCMNCGNITCKESHNACQLSFGEEVAGFGCRVSCESLYSWRAACKTLWSISGKTPYCICRGENCHSKEEIFVKLIVLARKQLKNQDPPIENDIRKCAEQLAATADWNILDAIRTTIEPTTESPTSTTTTIRPLRTVGPKVVRQGVFKGETYDQLMKRFKESKDKQRKSHTKTSGFTFKWWYSFLIIALLVTIGLFGIVIWSAATRKKRCAEYWKKKNAEKIKTGKVSSAENNKLDPVQREANMEVIPTEEIPNKGPIHLDKKFKGEMVHSLANEKSQSIHEKLEFVPQLNEEVEIGSYVDIIEGIEQVTCESTLSVSRIDNFNTVRQASSTSTTETRKTEEKKP